MGRAAFIWVRLCGRSYRTVGKERDDGSQTCRAPTHTPDLTTQYISVGLGRGTARLFGQAMLMVVEFLGCHLRFVWSWESCSSTRSHSFTHITFPYWLPACQLVLLGATHWFQLIPASSFFLFGNKFVIPPPINLIINEVKGRFTFTVKNSRNVIALFL